MYVACRRTRGQSAFPRMPVSSNLEIVLEDPGVGVFVGTDIAARQEVRNSSLRSKTLTLA